MKNIIAVSLVMLLFFHIAVAQDGIKAGNFITEPPTLMNLGFEWQFTGDANRNATVETAYRIVGTNSWKEALPLLRIGGERIFREAEQLEYLVP
ncbi:MAG: hypothetical protein ACSLE0_16600, partial [Chitinophagaceae bacterium]